MLLASAGAFGEPKKIYGVGAATCDNYLTFSKAVIEKPDHIKVDGMTITNLNNEYERLVDMFESWALGYASATEELTLIRGLGINEIFESINQYCKKYPEHNFIESVKNLNYII